MKLSRLMATAGAAALLSTTALAAATTIKTLPESGIVTLRGTVDSVENEREFTLRDSKGDTIGIDMEAGQSTVIKKGDEVSVTGNVDSGILGTDINATSVTVGKGLLESMNDTAKSVPGVSTLSAQAFNIKDLPSAGAVKVTGTVTEVDNEKEFTLRDDTGSIDVDVKSNENAQLSEGAKVTVIGNVKQTAMGRDIHASQVLVVTN